MIIIMIFNMSTSYFSQILISLFWGLLNDKKTDLTVKYNALYYVIRTVDV
jgi:hypothetical protein